VPAAADARRAPDQLHPRAGALHQGVRFHRLQPEPDPSGGYWKDPPLTDKWWYPFYEKLVELDVPAMIHVSMSCNPNFHTTGGHYINGDTTAFMQLITADLFKDFPSLKVHHPPRRRRQCRTTGAAIAGSRRI
jgi:predicted TIM-barrel fold metal-dependent hydrolase